jgi:hypothetical protein
MNLNHIIKNERFKLVTIVAGQDPDPSEMKREQMSGGRGAFMPAGGLTFPGQLVGLFRGQ